MGLIKCKDCGAEISSNALSCPKCGSSWVSKAAKGIIKGSVILWGSIFGFLALLAFIGAIISSNEPKLKTTESIETKIIKGRKIKVVVPVDNFFAKDYPSGWPFTVDSINVTCKKTKNGFWGILAKTGGKTYALNSDAEIWLGHPYPNAILDIEGFNKLRKLEVSKSSWKKFEPFTTNDSLDISDITYTLGDSPLGEALDKFCGD